MSPRRETQERKTKMGAKKKILYLFLAVCFMWIVQPETVSADGGIRVNGTDILQAADQTIPCGSGTAKYDPATKTLTLNHAEITGDNVGKALVNGIDINEQGVTVELVGQNLITACRGIGSSYPFLLKGIGGGSLAVNASKNDESGTLFCSGINIDGGGLTVQDANLQFTVSGLSANVSGYGLYINGGENRISNSNIVIDMMSAFDTDTKSIGINVYGEKSLTISDNSSITMNKVDMGINMGGGNLTISGSRLAVPDADVSAISCNNLEILNGSDVTAIANSRIALQANVNITISNSTVNAESAQSNSILCNNYAAIESSNVTAKGYWPALFLPKDTVIKDSVIEAESTADVGIYCKEGNLEVTGSEVTCTSKPGWKGIFIKGNLTMTDSKVVSPAESGVSGIHANGDITITGGTTEIGAGSISSENNIHIGGIITSNGVPSYENISSNNANGQVTFLDADYSAVDEAIAKAKALNKADYINFDTVEAAVNAVVRGKDVREQDVVDGYASAIEAAIAGLKPLPAVSVIEGADQMFVIGKNKGVTIKADGDFSKFAGVSVDGTEIAKEHYTAAAGSTIITLKPEYLKTLTAGKHTVAIRFTDGLAQTTLTIQEEGSGNPSEKPDDPSEKPDNPSEKPDNPSEKPDNPSEKPDNPSEKPDDPSDETGQQPPKDPSQNQTQKPAQKPSQSQGNSESSPKTGDNTPAVWLLTFAAVSAAGLAAGKRWGQ
jgi:hypothetical protein